MTNIKDDPVYDPFPKSGLVKEHEQIVRDYVKDFCRHYPNLNQQEVLFRAVELAIAAERVFKPERASFKTYLAHRLKELHRLHDQEERHQGVEIYRTEEDLAHEKAEEEGEPTDPVNFTGGGNGVRLLFDLQWWQALLFSDLVSRLLHPTTEKRHRLKLGTQLRQSDNAIEVHKRISADLPHVIRQQPPTPELMGWISALVDHLIRRQREADAEAEKRLVGDHSPTFLEAIHNAVDGKFYKGRRPPRFLPKWMPMARLDDMWSHNHEEEGNSLHDTVATPNSSSIYQKELQAALEAVKAVRPTLTNKNDLAVLDALEARLEGRASGGLDQLAKDLGMQKGTVSKVAHRLSKLFGARRAK